MVGQYSFWAGSGGVEALASDSHDILLLLGCFRDGIQPKKTKPENNKNCVQFLKKNTPMAIRFCILLWEPFGRWVFGIAGLKYQEDPEN